MDSKVVRVKMPPDLIASLDAMAKTQYASRSEFIRQAVVEKIRALENPNYVTRELPTGLEELQDLYDEVRMAYIRRLNVEERSKERKERR